MLGQMLVSFIELVMLIDLHSDVMANWNVKGDVNINIVEIARLLLADLND